MMGGIKAHYDCIKAFSETDFTEDLKKIEVPTFVMHGEDDQIVPLEMPGRSQPSCSRTPRRNSILAFRMACQQRTRNKSTPTCSPLSGMSIRCGVAGPLLHSAHFRSEYTILTRVPSPLVGSYDHSRVTGNFPTIQKRGGLLTCVAKWGRLLRSGPFGQ